MVASKIILFLFSSKRESSYIYAVIVSQGFKIRNNWFYTFHKIAVMVRKKSVSSAEDSVYYLQFSNCKNIKDSDSLRKYDKICVH